MTTPPTPSGWYPDPEHAGQFRYWDGQAWTEHRSPEGGPPAPSAQETPAEPAGTGQHVGAHRAPDAEPEPEPSSDWTSAPAQEPAASEPAPLSFTEQPTTKMPLREPAPYADATTPTPPEPPEVEPPAGTEPRTPVDNRKLVMGFGAAVAALLLLLIIAAVYAFVIHKPDTAQHRSPTTETSTTTVQATPSAEPSATEPPAPAAGATDGPLTFSVTGVDRGPTVSDPGNESLTKDAQGEFIVVHLTVQNTSPDPGQFLGTFQKLKGGGQVFSVDDEATFYVGGGSVDIPPGGQVDVGLAYDVPPGTTPASIELHSDPTSPGVELPIA